MLQTNPDIKIVENFISNRFGFNPIIAKDDELPVMLPIDLEITQKLFSDKENGRIVLRLRPEEFEKLKDGNDIEHLEGLLRLKGEIYFNCLTSINKDVHYFEFTEGTKHSLYNDSIYLAEKIITRLIRDTANDSFSDNDSIYTKNKELIVFNLLEGFRSEEPEQLENSFLDASLIFGKELMEDIFSILHIKENFLANKGVMKSLSHKLEDLYHFINQSSPPYGVLELQLITIAEDLLAKEFDIKRPESSINVRCYLAENSEEASKEGVQVKYKKGKLANGHEEYTIGIYLSDDIHKTLLTSTHANIVGQILSQIEAKLKEKISNTN